MNKLHYCLLLSLTILTACAPPPQPAAEVQAPTTMPVAERKAQTATISSWDLSGAIAARGNKKAWTATLNWLQQGANHYQIRLFGPIGSGTVMIDGQGDNVTFTDGAKKLSSSNATQLLKKETGIGLPVKSLYYWVRGLPAPGPVQASKRDKYNHLTLLKQNGYTIQYPGYTTAGNVDLPSQIRLNGNGVFMKLIIKRWKV